MTSPHLNLPQIITASDYHEFEGILDTLNHMIEWPDDVLRLYEKSIAKKRLPLLGCLEFSVESEDAFGDFYQAILYSPFLMGKKLTEGAQDFYEIVLDGLNKNNESALKKSKSQKSLTALSSGNVFITEKDFLDIELTVGSKESHKEAFLSWKAGKDKEWLLQTPLEKPSTPKKAKQKI